MAPEIADRDVVARLHLPPLPPPQDPMPAVQPRRGGLVLAAVGLLVAVVAALAWTRDQPGWTWAYLALVWLGAHQVIVGLAFALRPRR